MFFQSIADMHLISSAQLRQESSNLVTQYEGQIRPKSEVTFKTLVLKETHELMVRKKVDTSDELSFLMQKAVKPTQQSIGDNTDLA